LRSNDSTSCHLRQHSDDVGFNAADVGLDLFQPARRSIAIRIAVEIDFVTDDPNLAVFCVAQI
jgi:hypothetical protein